MAGYPQSSDLTAQTDALVPTHPLPTMLKRFVLPCWACDALGTTTAEEATAATQPCRRCHTVGAIEVSWAVSSWDNRAHLFTASEDGSPATAAYPCEHSVPTNRLLPYDGNAELCQVCRGIAQDSFPERQLLPTQWVT